MRSLPKLKIRKVKGKGRGVFTLEFIRRGTLVVTCTGQLHKTGEMSPNHMAMQVGDDLWLCSDGERIDDFINHSCEPNVGFVAGDLSLYALRSIRPGEEICWDYSTSLTEPGWVLNCRCRSPRCRRVVRPFRELTPEEQARLRPIALQYIRDRLGS